MNRHPIGATLDGMTYESIETHVDVLIPFCRREPSGAHLRWHDNDPREGSLQVLVVVIACSGKAGTWRKGTPSLPSLTEPDYAHSLTDALDFGFIAP